MLMYLITLKYWFTGVLKVVWLYYHNCEPFSNVGGVDNVSLLKLLDSESTAANGNRYCVVALSYALLICLVGYMHRFYSDLRLVANGFHLCQKIGNVYNYLFYFVCCIRACFCSPWARRD